MIRLRSPFKVYLIPTNDQFSQQQILLPPSLSFVIVIFISISFSLAVIIKCIFVFIFYIISYDLYIFLLQEARERFLLGLTEEVGWLSLRLVGRIFLSPIFSMYIYIYIFFYTSIHVHIMHTHNNRIFLLLFYFYVYAVCFSSFRSKTLQTIFNTYPFFRVVRVMA